MDRVLDSIRNPICHARAWKGNGILLAFWFLFVQPINGSVAAQSLGTVSENLEVTRDSVTLKENASIQQVPENEGPWSFGGFPIIFFSAETRWAFGAGAQFIYKEPTDRLASAVRSALFYSQNKQYSISVGAEYIPGDGDYRYSIETGHSFWPDKFFGIGNNTSKDSEEGYAARRTVARVIFQRKIYAELLAGLQYGYFRATHNDLLAAGMLDSGTIPGSKGGVASGIGMVVTWDSRDDNIYPTRGSFHQFTTTHAGPFLGSDFAFNSYLLDGRYYQPFFSDHVLATRMVVGLSNGNQPFYLLNYLGQYLRGYFPPRVLDKNVVAVQTEYRLPIVGRFGAVVFAGFGEVANHLGQFSLAEIKPSVGLGIRFALIPEQKLNLRMDMGIGKGDGSFDINLLEVF